MKIKEFLKLFEKLDPELEIGIFESEYFNTKLRLDLLNEFVTNEGIVYAKRQYSDTIKVIDIQVE